MHPIYIALWMRMRLSHAYWEQREVIEPVHLASKAALRLAGSRQAVWLIVWDDGIGSIRIRGR